MACERTGIAPAHTNHETESVASHGTAPRNSGRLTGMPVDRDPAPVPTSKAFSTHSHDHAKGRGWSGRIVPSSSSCPIAAADAGRLTSLRLSGQAAGGREPARERRPSESGPARTGPGPAGRARGDAGRSRAPLSQLLEAGSGRVARLRGPSLAADFTAGAAMRSAGSAGPARG